MALLRDGLLDGHAVALCGASADVRTALTELGARTEGLDREHALTGKEEGLGEWARAHSPLRALVYDAAPAFGEGGAAGLRAALEQAWIAVREVASGALIPGGKGGKLVLVGPRGDAGPHAEAARAGLENLARTLSVEWARFQVTTVMLARGQATTAGELAQVVCFLCSPAGGYISGSRISLR